LLHSAYSPGLLERVKVGFDRFIFAAVPTMAKKRRSPLRRRRAPKPDRRRALELLASCRDGCTEAIMLAHGFTVPQMVELVRAGLATATSERVVAGRHKIEVARVRITEAGRRALAGWKCLEAWEEISR
jgi:hypothetical protein